MEAEVYRWEAKSEGAFVKQVVKLVASGHYFYVRCKIGEKRCKAVQNNNVPNL